MSGKTVLLVEDNDDNRTLFGIILRYHDFHVLEAHDGESAVAMAVEHRPDLILMDIGLPGINGLEATARIKGDVRTSAIPVLALTAYHHAERDARSAGCDDFLTKPCLPERVIDAVGRHLAGASGRRTA